MEEFKQENKIYSVNELEFKQHSFVLLASKRMSGKTVMVQNLIKYFLDKYDFDTILMISDTAKFTKDYDFIDKDLIFKTDEMEDKIKKILQIQEKNINKNKNVNILLILDDVKVHSKSKELINVATLGRHLKITCILSSQYPKQLVSSSIRNNLSYVLINDLGEQALKAIWECQHIKYSFREFQEFVNEHNNNFTFILYDGITQKKDERLKLVKGELLQNLKIVNK